ncbi:hypothetical protein LIER_27843 [Lithospermum erythrorhizon]|uniref:Uncharacterized protein n=1 Tax=Lithospermum erythrorhizon TaxID=34254 RepID=A0AAV3RH55_LITER
MPTTIHKKECKTKMPFLDGVSQPKGFILPQFTQYNRIGDPIKHLQGFLVKMTITSNDPEIYAKAFSNSLTDRALDWGKSSKRQNYEPLPQKGLVQCTRRFHNEGLTPLRVSVAEIYA